MKNCFLFMWNAICSIAMTFLCLFAVIGLIVATMIFPDDKERN